MRAHNFIQSSKEQDILSAWREGVADAARSPEVIREVGGRERELLPRFAEHYEKLCALPRRARRGVQRKWKHSLAGVALFMALGAGPVTATTFNIPCPGGVGNNAALIQAINNANDETANPGVDTINLVSNCTHTLTAANTFYGGPTGLPVVTSEITIAGNGSTIRRDSAAGTPNFRIFAVGSIFATLTLQQTTVTGGKTSSVGEGGGGMYIYSGTLRLNNSTISGNSTSGNRSPGGGVYGYGGALYITDSTISGNSTSGKNSGGGGMFIDSFVRLYDSTISGNSTSGPQSEGGGVSNFATLSVIDSTISGNSTSDYGSDGGGVYNFIFGSLGVVNSTISGNSVNYSSDGGGVVNINSMTIANSTISGNSAVDVGGGVRNFSYMRLRNTIISGNTAGDFASEVSNNSTSNDIRLYGSNLFGHSGLTNTQALSSFTPGSMDITATSDGTTPTALASILNTTLQNNGGPTQTHALVGGSPAVDAVTTGCPLPATDQRGVVRPQGAACDIGAFELDAVTCNGLVATIIGTSGNNTINGTNGPDVIAGLGGNDTINALGGNDVICAGDGRDTVNGGNGRDTLLGEGGNDILSGGDRNDRLFGGDGNDTISGGNGDDTMQGGANTDSCDGGPNSDTATGCETTVSVP